MVDVRNCTWHSFEIDIQNRSIICFCAGWAMVNLCDKYPFLINKILYIVDNYAKETQIVVQGVNLPIRRMKEIGEEVKNSILLISSLKYADELVKQMDRIPMLDKCCVYVPTLFENEMQKFSIPPLETQRIPKKIHYCWFGHSDMPEQFKANIETWKKNCPDYEIVRWDESNYDVTKNKYMHQAYEKKKWGFVPDYARLDIIYEHGGIYLDTDVEIIKPLDDLLQYKMFCGFESKEYVAFGLGFGAQKNHPILKSMMEDYDKEYFINEDGTLNILASPVYQTRVLEQYGLIKNGRMQEWEDYVVFPTECFAPINAYGIGYPKRNTFSIHQYAATWFDEEQKKNKERIVSSCMFLMSRMGAKD